MKSVNDEGLTELEKYGAATVEQYTPTSWLAKVIILVEELDTYLTIKSDFEMTRQIAVKVCLERVLKSLEDIKNGKNPLIN